MQSSLSMTQFSNHGTVSYSDQQFLTHSLIYPRMITGDKCYCQQIITTCYAGLKTSKPTALKPAGRLELLSLAGQIVYELSRCAASNNNL